MDRHWIMLKATVRHLVTWYQNNKRDLPWRETKDPYCIWISETMLQQTTSRAVIPFYQRFLDSFPSVDDLAKASEGKVLENWAGLGYYSRARNLHKAAKIISEQGFFPEEVEDLLALPGLGPYTARAVASIAFEKPAGVVDGNTIRVMSRFYDQKQEWWKTAGRRWVQETMDEWVSKGSPSEINQAVMELGASHCSPTKPSCLLCPIKKGCATLTKNKNPEALPLKKPKKASEIWVWQPEICERRGKVALMKNSTLPFLRDQWILPGTGVQKNQKPKNYDYTHSITHHKIYVRVKRTKSLNSQKGVKWVPIEEIPQWCPVSLVQKALKQGE